MLKESLGENILEQLLILRGISKKDRDVFLSPDYDEQTHDPFLFRDMDKATDRLKKALDQNEHIVVFGDYDADGTCGTVVLTDFLRKVGHKNFEVYIPDRYNEGYGLKMEHVKEFVKNKTALLIAIDCGVTSLDEIAYGNAHGIDTMVFDHHLIPPVWPEAYAIVNPKKPNETYPYKYICGTALAFKLVHAMLLRFDFGIPAGWEKWLLDAVAIATVADMVPLTGENRVLLRYGITVLKRTRRIGLRELYKKANLNTRYFQTDDIGFVIAPRINAASRLDHATISYELLTTENREEAERLAAHLDELNVERKRLVEEMMREAHSVIAHMDDIPEVLFLGKKEWNPGVLGIVANRLLEVYHRPIFVWGGEGEESKGSCRGGEQVNVVELMRHCESYFSNMGGHAAAGGFSFKKGNEEQIATCLSKAHQEKKNEEQEHALYFDAQIAVEDINEATLQLLKQLEPFGMENEKPLFLLANVRPVSVEAFGKNGGGHVRVRFRGDGGVFVTGIGFGLGDHIPQMHNNGEPIDVACHIEENYFAGRRELRLRIVAIRHAKKIEFLDSVTIKQPAEVA